MEKIQVSWEAYITDIWMLANAIRRHQFICTASMQLTHIVGIPRGGLIPAVVLCEELQLRWTDEAELKLKAKEPMRCHVLLVDDIVDSGHTMLQVLTRIALSGFRATWSKSITTAAVYTKGEKGRSVNFSARAFALDEWVVFPYEKDRREKRDGTANQATLSKEE